MKAKGYLFWVYINNADTKYDPQWKVTLVMDKTEAKRIKDIGLKVRMIDDMSKSGAEMAKFGTHEVRFNRYCEGRGKAAGRKNPQPKQALLVDGKKVQFTGIVGNGSKAEVVFDPYEWGDKKGWSGDLVGIIIHDLVEYVPEGGGEAPPSESDSEFDDMEMVEEETPPTPEAPEDNVEPDEEW